MSYKIAKEYSELDAESVMDMTIPELQNDFSKDLDDLQKATNEFVDEAQEEIEGYLEDSAEVHGEKTKIRELVPGSEASILTEEDVEPVIETTYEENGDLSKFMGYISKQYPAAIPTHDGSSVLGCEKAMSFLTSLSREILKNIKLDLDDSLDVVALEKINNSILADILKLKEHVKNLKKKIKNASSNEELVKLAATPNNVVISVTPFIRAICGILINSCVSAGKPFEEVYEYLKSKYEIKPREELEILQTLMDFGQPIFKDRGSLSIPESISNKKETEEMESALGGVDFVRSYFS